MTGHKRHRHDSPSETQLVCVRLHAHRQPRHEVVFDNAWPESLSTARQLIIFLRASSLGLRHRLKFEIREIVAFVVMEREQLQPVFRESDGPNFCLSPFMHATGGQG